MYLLAFIFPQVLANSTVFDILKQPTFSSTQVMTLGLYAWLCRRFLRGKRGKLVAWVTRLRVPYKHIERWQWNLWSVFTRPTSARFPFNFILQFWCWRCWNVVLCRLGAGLGLAGEVVVVSHVGVPQSRQPARLVISHNDGFGSFEKKRDRKVIYFPIIFSNNNFIFMFMIDWPHIGAGPRGLPIEKLVGAGKILWRGRYL